ncbi:MAG: carboxypeptidase-like regulatory domain-containing protein [Desulfobacterales bacterium]|nr:carboxypeptidase-like regulatory domain-containing protein [Desulfobacterales bacterium]
MTATADVTHDVALVRGVTVSGLVTNSAGTAQQNVRVRAFQAGSLVLSTLTDAAGAYSLTLAPGPTTSRPSRRPASRWRPSPYRTCRSPGPPRRTSCCPRSAGRHPQALLRRQLLGCATFRGWNSGRARGPSRRSSERIAAGVLLTVLGPRWRAVSTTPTVAARPGSIRRRGLLMGLAPVTFAASQVAGRCDSAGHAARPVRLDRHAPGAATGLPVQRCHIFRSTTRGACVGRLEHRRVWPVLGPDDAVNGIRRVPHERGHPEHLLHGAVRQCDGEPERRLRSGLVPRTSPTPAAPLDADVRRGGSQRAAGTS